MYIIIEPCHSGCGLYVCVSVCVSVCVCDIFLYLYENWLPHVYMWCVCVMGWVRVTVVCESCLEGYDHMSLNRDVCVYIYISYTFEIFFLYDCIPIIPVAKEIVYIC